MPRRGRLLGLDLGSRRIGVAVTDADQRLATPVQALARGEGPDDAVDHSAIAALVEEYAAVGVVVGVPLSLSGATGPAARQVLAEISRLQEALDVEVATVDERFTTAGAARALKAAGRSAKRQRPVVDQTAAAMLLQTFVDCRSDDTVGAVSAESRPAWDATWTAPAESGPPGTSPPGSRR